jgi:hypothetical protein
MARKFLTPLSPPSLQSDPEFAIAGSIYYNTTSNLLKFYNGSSWVALTSGGSSENVLLEHRHSYDGSISYVGELEYSPTNLFDGGNASSTYDSIIDGGSAGSIYDTTIDGGTF